MKPKPLDLEGIEKSAIKELNVREAGAVLKTIDFVKQQIKSALNGLIEDIELECKPYDMLYGEVGNRKLSFVEIKQFIKKWFPDVVRDD